VVSTRPGQVLPTLGAKAVSGGRRPDRSELIRMISQPARRAFLTGLLLFSTVSGVWARPFVANSGYLETFKSASVTTVPEAGTGEVYRVYHLEFVDGIAAAKFQDSRFTEIHRGGRFVDIFAPPTDQALEVLANLDGLVWLDYNHSVEVPAPPTVKSVGATRASKEPVARLGVSGYTGKGVTLALIDSGFDVRHPDFQTVGPDGKPHSRFVALWDTTETRSGLGQPAHIKYPNGQPIGVIYSRQDIDNYLATPPEQRPDILWDGNGHGTSVAGIAAGNGRGLEGQPYAGVASEADLIGIRLGDKALNTYLISAFLAWLDSQVGERPLVISNSWGGHRSGHDGSSLVERQIDERFPLDRPGRLVLFAAGNEGSDGLHSAAKFQGSTMPGTLKMPRVGPQDEVEVTVYFDSADPSLTTEPEVELVSFVHGVTGQTVWRLQPTPGKETLAIYSKEGKSGRFNAYIAGTIGDKKAFFEPEVATYEGLVNNPGTAENVLTVGSYDFNPFFEQGGQLLTLGVGAEFNPMTVGDISGYSSPGLTRLGRLKPDLTAPGQWWTAPAPLEDNDDLAYDTSGLYNLFNGTSAATPYTAGVMALLLEKNPRLTLRDVRALLDRHLKSDAYTGRVPNPIWGRGKLTLSAVEAMLAEP
jgi:subtilisin family serine protease